MLPLMDARPLMWGGGMVIGPPSDLADVINRAHFGVDRKRGYEELVNVGLFVWESHNGPYNIAQHYHTCM